MQLLMAALVALGAFFGSFLGSYFKKKGENLATHEDIGKLVNQMSAVTKATKEIETKITSDAWDRQRHWELKRDVLFDATRRLADINDSLVSLASMLQVDLANQQAGRPESLELSIATNEKWLKAFAAIKETTLLVGIVCEEETKQAFESFGVFVSQIAMQISKKDSEIYRSSKADLDAKQAALRAAIRKELGIEGPG